MAKENASIQIQFLGAAGTVTGSKTLLKTDKYKILIDCGLFQGNKPERKLNKLKKLPFKPSEVDAIILTHGHLDHSGYLPVLVKKGFTGPIYATTPSKSITETILHDSAKIQEEDTQEANKRRSQARKPLKPLYREKHVNRTLQLFETYADKEWIVLNEEVKFRFIKSGHILGSATVELECQGKRFVFSGDIGQRMPLILNAPMRPQEADYIIMESTYGNKLHDNSISPYQALQEVVNKAFEKGGSVVIPSFAVERAQEIIMLLNNLIDEKNIPAIPIYLDTPMGIDITKVFQEYRDWHNLSDDECENLTKNVHIISSFGETLTVLDENGPKNKIIIAGSGMVTGGRVLYYLKHLLKDDKNTVLLVGHQAKGTRGNQLSSGEATIEIDGENYEVNAEISQIGSLSAHADQGDLLWWLKDLKEAPKQLFLNHGEEEATKELKHKIEETYGWQVTVAEMDKVYEA
ncbi:MBL fold metallo-hydrolase RNA specificity domain-containing protein [Pontibacter silvestris]|uniref:MBL fold metallo-hydrolase RNA specificity domain-containing protein n=1 Tax=Pontibacter silvestris TaxID=2305183 RepID=A0ABW4WXK7_9BACT|nr:MBL fold metallo-hydrolase [Pontibacter silvestris]MCC9137422.1 MBL fold metallo-hydrolase [Pontibacter silvestris]